MDLRDASASKNMTRNSQISRPSETEPYMFIIVYVKHTYPLPQPHAQAHEIENANYENQTN